jgi:hypothetical protein
VTPAIVASGAVLVAGCLLSKLSGPILAPIVVTMLAIRLIDGRPIVVSLRATPIEYGGRARQLLVILGVLAACSLVAWGLVWASYGFRYGAFAAATTGKDTFLGQRRSYRAWSVGSCPQLGASTSCPKRTFTRRHLRSSTRPNEPPSSTDGSEPAAGGGTSRTPLR